MLKLIFICSSLLSLLCVNAVAESVANPLFAKADVAAGKALHATNCVSCHASSYGGDGSGIYTRDYAKVKTSKGLVAQVRNCNTMIGLKWFEDEELNVAAYLNHTYYKFEK
ncbi:MAG: cytochrome c [Bdellovibrio sp.]|nr:cytochrome c [Methylotenera sp.]